MEYEQFKVASGKNTIFIERNNGIMFKVLFFISTLFCVFVTNAQVSQIHWGAKQNPVNGLTISWVNTIPGDSIKWGYDNKYEKGSFAVVNTVYQARYICEFTFFKVLPDTFLLYSIYDAYTGAWSEAKIYKTPKGNSSYFSFIAMGDSRTYWDKWQLVSENVLPADFAIFMGDIVTAGGDTTDWDNWFKYGKSYLENNQVFHCLGNHELRGDVEAVYYKALFALPQSALGNELYYSFVHNNSLFVCLNSEKASDTLQYQWLINTLKTSQNYNWTFVWFHRPFFTNPSHIGEMNAYFDTWWKAFDDYGVDVIFNGHSHNYQRTVPINYNIRKDSMVAEYGNCSKHGRCQIVTGGAGAPLVGEGSGWFINETYNGNHFVNVEVFADSLIIKALTPEQIIVDSFSLVRKFKPKIIGNELPVCFGDTVTLSGTGAQWFNWESGIVNNKPFIPETTKTYMVVAVDSFGCTDTLLVDVEVMPVYNFYDTVEVCNGDSVLWQNEYRKLGADYVEQLYTDQSCDSIYFLNLVVHENPDNIEIIGNTNVFSDTRHKYFVNPVVGYSYEWQVENGSIFEGYVDTIIFVDWGSDTVGYVYAMAIGDNGCKSNMDTLAVTIEKGVGLNDNYLKEVMFVDNLLGEIALNSSVIKSVKIYNSLGAIVAVSDTDKIRISDISVGVYIIVLNYKNGYSEAVKFYKP